MNFDPATMEPSLSMHRHPLAARPDFSAGCSSIFAASGSVAASDTGACVYGRGYDRLHPFFSEMASNL